MADSAVPEVPGYTVGRELGRGGSSTVWLVTDERTGTDFALKCFVPAAPPPGPAADTAPDAAVESGVRREIRILSALDHPHLVKAHDVLRVVLDSRDGLGLLVDYAPGGSLAQLVASRGKLSIGETVTVLTPIAQVLGYLHANGFTHSDVSPGNVLFTSHGKPLLADVGIARMVGDVAAVPGHGTRGFMDPAPVDAVRAGLQPERDVYSVAALGWYCLTGDIPGRTSDRPPLPLILPNVPTELAAALEAGLNEDRRLRPTAVELAAAVYRSAAPLPVDLAGSVHPTVLPELLTRRPLPERSGSGVRESLHSWRRRMSTSRWSGVIGARQVLPFPRDGGAESPLRISGAASRTAPQVSTDPPPAGGDTAGAGPARPGGRHVGAARRRPVNGSRVLSAAALLAVLAAAWWVAVPGGTAPAGPDHVLAGSGDSQDRDSRSVEDPAQENPARESRSAGPADVRIPDTVTAQLGSADPGEAVQGLASLRSLAFSSGRLELLEQVNAQGSTASAADGRIAGPLRESGHVLAGFTSLLSDVRVHPDSNESRAVVAVTSAASAYEEVDRSGGLVATGLAAPPQQLRLVLVQVDGTWRVAEILPGL
ncbi:serine/threonine-protein kinase [Arthrobacter sp. BE255]|uniref:serine/threonine-protein kinase n=1 Tax=Arthrobacter sp. BE255 TaxID=2817721 RepID=UPI0028674050|nr:serine/threonine-protein kinase [Arthrobacter sp. BE255]MDR7159296.1 serine/threonine protein kinase [Arthrobacter sp. BE255]